MINLTKENAHDSADNDFFRWNIDGVEVQIGSYEKYETLRITVNPYSMQGIDWNFHSMRDHHIMGEEGDEEFLPASIKPYFTEKWAVTDACVDMEIFGLASILLDAILNDEDWD